MTAIYEITLRRILRDAGGKPENEYRELQGVQGPPRRGARPGEFLVGPDYESGAFDEVIFDVSPSVSETRSAEYVDQALPGPVGITVYKLTGNRRFSINAKIVSRTEKEAAKNYGYVNVLRSWLIPQSADGSNAQVGRPPLLRLNGYLKQFYNIPVVLADLNINFPEDVDYIEVTEDAMVPIVQSIDLTLIESHKNSLTKNLSKNAAIASAQQQGSSETVTAQSEFNLKEFKEGQLLGY
jgi:hypothetical protein